MSWRERKQDTYVNHGKVTTTTLNPSTSSEFYKVTQDQKMLGAQQVRTFEGVFPSEEAEAVFSRLSADAHAEKVEAVKSGKVLPGIIDEEDSTP